MGNDPFNRSPRYRQARINGVYFEPWIRKDYGFNSRWETPVLIVSESHYEWDDDRWARGDLLPRDETIRCTKNRAEEAEPRMFATNLATAFLGRQPKPNPPHGEMHEFWNSVAFYNFVQECVGKPNMRPTPDGLRSSLKGFSTVLSELQPKPRLVVVLGRLVWDTLKPHSPEQIPEYRTDDGQLVAGLPHLTRAFKAERWHPEISKLLDRARHFVSLADHP